MKYPKGLAGRIFNAPYSSTGIRLAINDLIAEADRTKRVGDIDPNLLLTAVDADRQAPVIFGSKLASMSLYSDVSLADALLATSAAPTYFPAHRVGPNTFLDGGIIANAPDVIGLIEAMAIHGISPERIRIVSIGTCAPSAGLLPGKAKPHGLLGAFLSRKLFLTVMEAQEELAAELSRQLLGPQWIRVDFKPNPQEASVLGLDSATEKAKEVLFRSADNAFKNLGADIQGNLTSMLRSAG